MDVANANQTVDAFRFRGDARAAMGTSDVTDENEPLEYVNEIVEWKLESETVSEHGRYSKDKSDDIKGD